MDMYRGIKLRAVAVIYRLKVVDLARDTFGSNPGASQALAGNTPCDGVWGLGDFWNLGRPGCPENGPFCRLGNP
jgi:hypothetical protein